jgi:hypothetical protein
MEKQDHLWELADAPKSAPVGKVQARAFISRELNEWVKSHYKDSSLQIAEVYGDWLEEYIKERMGSERESNRRKAIATFCSDYKTILQELL